MAPTLLGPHVELTCHACGVRWPVHWQANLRPSGPVTCWNCGARVPIERAVPKPGTAVTLVSRRVDPRPPLLGELVVIEPPVTFQEPIAADHDGPAEIPRGGTDTGQGAGNLWAVKRVVATAGQQLSQRDGVLLVNGQPITERLEQAAAAHPDRVRRPLDIPVHDDRHRPGSTPSRWRPLAGSAPPIAVDADGFRLRARRQDATWTPSAWLAYHHQAVHDGLRPDVIRDDFPSNATEVRALQPVDRLTLRLRLDATAGGTVQVLFRLAGQSRSAIRTWQAGSSHLDFDSAHGEPWNGDASDFPQPDSTPTPIAIRILTDEAKISELVIRRPLQYRIAAADAVKGTWPLRLTEGQLYVLGDNVPLSIDSRQFGPIGVARLVGRIEPTC